MKRARSPAEVLRRVRRMSAVNGWSVAIFAGLAVLVALALGDFVGIAVGLLVGLGGAMEIRGSRQLGRGNPDGIRLLIRSQLVVLGVIWAYAATRLGSFDPGTIREAMTPDLRSMLTEVGVTLDDLLPFVRRAFYLLYGSVLALTLLYQGGLALYYRRRGPAVEEALRAPPTVPQPPVPGPPEDYLI